MYHSLDSLLIPVVYYTHTAFLYQLRFQLLLLYITP